MSLSRTPRSRANCSRVMGRNEPIAVSIYSFGLVRGMPYPWHKWRRPQPPSHNCTSLQVPFGSSAASLHLRTSALSGTPNDAIQRVHMSRRLRTVRRLLQQRALARLGWLCLVNFVSGEQACLLEESLAAPIHTSYVNRAIQSSSWGLEKQA